MLLSAHMTSVLFLVRFNNFDRTTGFFLVPPGLELHAFTQVVRSYALLSFNVSCVDGSLLQELVSGSS